MFTAALSIRISVIMTPSPPKKRKLDNGNGQHGTVTKINYFHVVE